jgi:hypothetical protein
MPYRRSYKKSSGEVIRILTEAKTDCTAGFNTFVPEMSAIEPLGIPHLALLVDSAPYHWEVANAPNTIASCVEQDSVQFFQMTGKNEVFYLPHAIDQKFFSLSFQKKIKQATRDLDLAVPATFMCYETQLSLWKKWFSKNSVNILIELAEVVLASQTLSHLALFIRLVERQHPLIYEMKEKQIPTIEFLNSLDHYI